MPDGGVILGKQETDKEQLPRFIVVTKKNVHAKFYVNCTYLLVKVTAYYFPEITYCYVSLRRPRDLDVLIIQNK